MKVSKSKRIASELLRKKEKYTINNFFFNDTATTEIYTLSLHDALSISTISLHGIHSFPYPEKRTIKEEEGITQTPHP